MERGTNLNSDLLQLDAVPFEFGVWYARRNIVKEPPSNHVFYGNERYKYYARPLSRNKNIPEVAPQFFQTSSEPPPPITISVETQTDYRDSETQTIPWETPYKIVSGYPEVLTLQHFTYEHGLPAGPPQIEDIERAREKEIWESEMPPICITDEQKRRRHQMIVQQKVKEAELTVSEIKAEQETKFAHIQSSLIAQLSYREQRKNKMLQNLWERKKAEMRNQRTKLQEKFARSIHTLDRKRSNLSKKFKEPSFDEFLNTGDTVSEQANTGDMHERKQNVEVLKDNYYLNTPTGIVALERWMWEEQKILMEPEIFLPKREGPSSYSQKVIEETENVFLTSKKKVTKTMAPKAFHVERRKLAIAPPSVSVVPDYILERIQSTILLQKLFRGRALQKEIQNIKNKYLNFITGLRETFPITEEERNEMEKVRIVKHAKYMQQYEEIISTKAREEIFARFEGETISKRLNMMGKAVTRHQSVQQIIPVIATATKQRHRREAEEGGRRQQEFIQKEIINHTFEQIQLEEEVLADKYIEDIINNIT